jgi:8-oxo-dGTP pyrophosphatase MutT (NUDIX family)
MKLRAGVIPYTHDKKFILIKSLKNGKLVFPKGKIKSNENEIEAASREAMEEAGIEGLIYGPVKIIKDITWYFMKVNKENKNFDEMLIRGKRRMSYEEVMNSDDVKDGVKDLIIESTEYQK